MGLLIRVQYEISCTMKIVRHTTNDLSSIHDQQRPQRVPHEATLLLRPGHRSSKREDIIPSITLIIIARDYTSLPGLILSLKSPPGRQPLALMVRTHHLLELAHDHAQTHRSRDVERAEREPKPCEGRNGRLYRSVELDDGCEEEIHRAELVVAGIAGGGYKRG
jgi:hypothetical protein